MTISSGMACRETVQSAFDDFLEAYPAYAQTFALDELRLQEFSRLDEQQHVYLDYTGAALYPRCLARDHISLLEQFVLGNPHSKNSASLTSTRLAYREWSSIPSHATTPLARTGFQRVGKPGLPSGRGECCPRQWRRESGIRRLGNGVVPGGVRIWWCLGVGKSIEAYEHVCDKLCEVTYTKPGTGDLPASRSQCRTPLPPDPSPSSVGHTPRRPEPRDLLPTSERRTLLREGTRRESVVPSSCRLRR